MLFELTRVVCTAEGARCVARITYEGAPRFALVSGMGTTATLLLQTSAQLLFSKTPGLGLPLSAQFKYLAAMLLGLGVACAVAAVERACAPCSRIARACRAQCARAEAGVTWEANSEPCGGESPPYREYRDAAPTAQAPT